jgi:hypothetical protein
MSSDNVTNETVSNENIAPPTTPYNSMEFEEFLKAIGHGNIKNWSVLAEALGVSRLTLLRWRNHPLAQNALNTAISEAMANMQTVGKDDWRMHREVMKIMGVKDKSTLEHEIGESVTEVLDKLETDYEAIGSKAREQMVAAQSPVQDKG